MCHLQDKASSGYVSLTVIGVLHTVRQITLGDPTPYVHVCMRIYPKGSAASVEFIFLLESTLFKGGGWFLFLLSFLLPSMPPKLLPNSLPVPSTSPPNPQLPHPAPKSHLQSQSLNLWVGPRISRTIRVIFLI